MQSFSENSRLHLTDDEMLRRVVSRALWASFPDEHTEDGIAAAASQYFRNKRGEPLNPRTIKYWLREEVTLGGLHLSTLFTMQPKAFISHWVGRRS